MAYDTRGDRSDRPMFEGNWTCSKCGNPITKLPFQPDPSRLDQLTCRDCFRESRGGDRPRRDDRPPRDMVKGDWKCSGCGAAITELPFQPDPSRLDQLKCKDCHRASRGDRY